MCKGQVIINTNYYHCSTTNHRSDRYYASLIMFPDADYEPANRSSPTRLDFGKCDFERNRIISRNEADFCLEQTFRESCVTDFFVKLESKISPRTVKC